MTLQQIKYLLCIVETGSIGQAAKKLFVAQSRLSAAIKELEHEFNLTIFHRNSRGVVLTHQGEEFCTDLRQMYNYYEYINEKYRQKSFASTCLCIAAHHHMCSEGVFLDLADSIDYQKYRFSYLEGTNSAVLDMVERGTADLGFMFFNEQIDAVFFQELRKRRLVFCQISRGYPHAYMYKTHPLAKESQVSSAALIKYPFVSYNATDDLAGIYTTITGLSSKNQRIYRVSDRAAAYVILQNCHASLIGSGYLSEYEISNGIISVPITDAGHIVVGYIKQENHILTEVATKFITLVESQCLSCNTLK